MTRWLAVVAATAVLTACAPETPDYQSIWDTTSTTAPATSAPTDDRVVPIAVFLEQNGVIGAPMTPDDLTGITITMPRPQGWEQVTDPNFPQAYEILRKTVESGYSPQALLMVFKLTGDFDVAEAINHGYADAQMSENFTQLNASIENFGGQPSAMIEGSYTLLEQRLHTYNRIVIPTSAPPASERYLIQFTVTTAADQAAAHAADVEQLISGFKVTVP